MIHRSVLNELEPELQTGFNPSIPDVQNQKERGSHHLTKHGREQSLSR